MATSASSPTARRFELARRLRELRLAAGKSVEEVARELMCSPAKISRMETAGRTVQARDVRDLLRFYDLPAEEQAEVMALAADARHRGWWQDYRSLNEQTQTYIGLESAAVLMREYQTLRMPGLLQTADYTRALVNGVRPPGYWDPGAVDEIVQARARRQARIQDGSLQLHTMVDEVAFTRVVGSVDVMAEQIAHLAEMSVLANVRLQLIPIDSGYHAGLDGSFHVLSFESGMLDDIVFIEGQYGNQILDKKDLVDRYLKVYEQLSGSVALSPERTTDWLDEHHRKYIDLDKKGRREVRTLYRQV